MTDVVLTLPIKAGEEALMFGRFLSNFLETLSSQPDRDAGHIAGPQLMMRADPPFDGEELKILTFQESSVASAFSAGWTKLRCAATAFVRG